MAIGIVVGLTGIQQYIPAFVVNTVDNLQGCMGPVAMILTGFVIGGFPIKEMISQKKVYIATGLRLIVIPLVILGVLKLCGANEYVISLAFFAYATPLGLNTVVFPAAYNGDTKTGAGMAMISHVLCVITIPVLYRLIKLI